MAISITGSVGVSRSQSVEPLPSADADNYLGAAYDVSGNNIVLRNISFKGTGGQIRAKGGIKADGSTSDDYDDYFYRVSTFNTSRATTATTLVPARYVTTVFTTAYRNPDTKQTTFINTSRSTLYPASLRSTVRTTTFATSVVATF